MGKFRISRNKKKARWPKGQSSSSNPENRKHRNASQRFAIGPGSVSSFPSKLTSENLLKHTAVLGGEIDLPGDDEHTVKTFETFASEWTQCTNVSFNKIIKRFDSGNAHHKEMLAILAAVTEVIKSRGGGRDDEDCTEYFGALLTTLEAADTEESLAAVLSLLSMIIKSVSRAVLVDKFSFVSKLLLDLLSKHIETEKVSLIRSLIGCLSVVLRAQNINVWNESSTMQIYVSMLSFIVHSKPKIRKASQHAIVAVLKGSSFMESDLDDVPSIHPAASRTAKHCVKLIEDNIGSGGKNNVVLYTLSLLKDIFETFPLDQVKAVAETILKIMTLGNSYVISGGMQSLYGLYSSRLQSSSLSPRLNAQLISALYNYQPSVNDAQPMVAWLTVQQEAFICLSGRDSKLCLSNLHIFFNTAVTKGWLSDRQEVVTASTAAMKCLTNECLRPSAEEFVSEKESLSLVEKMYGILSEGLKYQYHASWTHVFHLLSEFIDVFGHYSQCHKFIGKSLKSLVDLRESVNFTLTNELDYVVGKSIRKMGPALVLEIIPLNITGKETSYDFPRSWLLPVLKENVQKTELSYFIKKFLPLASVCLMRSRECESMSDDIGAKTYELIMHQIWSLLPGFCNSPSDLKASFKDIAKVLGTQLNERKELRMDILASLRQLILKSEGNNEDREELARFAKNYLPILFNIYTTTPRSDPEEFNKRFSVYETIKLYASITPSKLMESVFDTTLQKFTECSDGFIKESVLDLLQVLVWHVNTARVEKLYKICIAGLGSKDPKKQKKSYRILEDLCGSSKEEINILVASNIKEIEETLLNSLASSSPSSQAYRLRTLLHILTHLSPESRGQYEENVKFATAIIPEAILCIKANNEKARSAAYTLLVSTGESLIRWSEKYYESKEEGYDSALRNYIKTLIAGLAGDPTLINCTLLAITRIFYEFKDIFPEDIVEMLLSNVCILTTSNSREVVGAALSFFRVFTATHNVLKTTKYIESILKALVDMPEDCKRHFRLKTRYLLDKIIRKFGYDFVASNVPGSDSIMNRRIKNIRKLHARKARLEQDEDDGLEEDEEELFRIRGKPKTMDDILQDSDDEGDAMDFDENKKSLKTKKKNRRQTFISEESEDIVDFLDPTAAQKVTSSLNRSERKQTEDKTLKKKKNDPNGGFKMTADGKLIITEDADDSDGEDEGEEVEAELAAESRKRKYMMMNEDDSDDENTFKNLVSTSAAQKRKRGGSVASSKKSLVSSLGGLSKASTMKYKAGGTGIHRPLDQQPSSTPDYGSEYRSKKARGDVKRKGKPDPYAYVPLRTSNLNKRKRAKNAGQFKNLVKSAKSGASTGSKKAKRSKMTEVKHMMKKLNMK